MSGSKRAPDLFTRLKSNDCTNSSNVNNSCSVPGFQPNSAKKLTTVSGKYPSSDKQSKKILDTILFLEDAGMKNVW